MPKSPAARRDRSTTAPRSANDNRPQSQRLLWQRRDGQSRPIRRHPWLLVASIALLVGWLAALAALAFWGK